MSQALFERYHEAKAEQQQVAGQSEAARKVLREIRAERVDSLKTVVGQTVRLSGQVVESEEWGEQEGDEDWHYVFYQEGLGDLILCANPVTLDEATEARILGVREVDPESSDGYIYAEQRSFSGYFAIRLAIPTLGDWPYIGHLNMPYPFEDTGASFRSRLSGIPVTPMETYHGLRAIEGLDPNPFVIDSNHES